MRRAIQKYLEDPLSEEILKGNLKDGEKIKVKYKKGNETLTFSDDKSEDKTIADKDSNSPDESLNELEESKETKE